MIPRFSLPLTVLLGLSFWALCSVDLCHADDTTTLRCSADTEEPDPALVEIKYDVGLGEETCMVYVQPDVTFGMYCKNIHCIYKVFHLNESADA